MLLFGRNSQLCSVSAALCCKSDAWQFCWLAHIFARKQSKHTIIPSSLPCVLQVAQPWPYSLHLTFSQMHLRFRLMLSEHWHWHWTGHLSKGTKIIQAHNPMHVYKKGTAWTVMAHARTLAGTKLRGDVFTINWIGLKRDATETKSIIQASTWRIAFCLHAISWDIQSVSALPLNHRMITRMTLPK